MEPSVPPQGSARNGVDRLKYLDGKKPRDRSAETGKGGAHDCGLIEALAVLERTGGPLYLVNGEPSVWACASRDVPAFCLCGSEGEGIPKWLLDVLPAALFGIAIHVVLDADKAGRAAALKRAAELRAAGCDVEALDIRAALPGLVGGDVDDLHRRVGAGLADALAALPILQEEKPEPPIMARPLPELLDAVEAAQTRYVVFRSQAQRTAAALWALHTHTIDAFNVTPYLNVRSTTPECGKSRLLEVLNEITPNAWLAISPTEPVLFRSIAVDNPTLLLDETDGTFAKGAAADPRVIGIRGILNSGWGIAAASPSVGASGTSKS